VRLRAETLAPIRDAPQAAPHLARGATMNQRQMLDLVLAELGTGQPAVA
jgi:hypothetical protein